MLVHGQSVKNCGHIRLRNFFQGIELGFAIASVPSTHAAYDAV